MNVEVREQCVGGNGLRSGCCGNDKLVTDRKEGVKSWLCRHSLGLAKFRKGGNGLLYAVRLLAMGINTTISGSNLSTFYMGTLKGQVSVGPYQSYEYQSLTGDHSRRIRGPVSTRYVWYICRILPLTARW